MVAAAVGAKEEAVANKAAAATTTVVEDPLQAHTATLKEVEAKQQACLTAFRSVINSLNSSALQGRVLTAIGELEEAAALIGRLQAELTDEPYVERIRILSSLLAKEVVEEEEGEGDGEEHEL